MTLMAFRLRGEQNGEQIDESSQVKEVGILKGPSRFSGGTEVHIKEQRATQKFTAMRQRSAVSI